MSTDSIADMLTRIRNANTAGHARVAIPASRVGVEIARVLKEEGYIANFDVATAEQGQKLDITFKPKSTRGKSLGESTDPRTPSTAPFDSVSASTRCRNFSSTIPRCSASRSHRLVAFTIRPSGRRASTTERVRPHVRDRSARGA